MAGKPGRLSAFRAVALVHSATHRIRLCLVLVCVAVVFARPSFGDSADEADLAAAISELNAALTRLKIQHSATTTELGYRLHEAYAASGIDRFRVEAINNPDLIDRLFDTTRTVAFFRPQSGALADRLVDLLLRIEAIGAADSEHFRKAYQAAFRARRFDRVSQIVDLGWSAPSVEVNDSVDSREDVRTVLVAADASGRFKRLAHHSDEGVEFVLLFDPFCGPSRDLLSRILTDPSASSVFSRAGLVLLPQYVVIDGRALYELQDALPYQVGLMYDYSEWERVQSTFTPTLYVFENGQPTRRMIGDPQEMLRLLKAH